MSEKLSVEKRLEALEVKITIIGTGFNEILTQLAGIGEAEKAEQETPSPSYDPSKIPWKEAEGARGKYERYPAEGEKPESTPDYENMLADLKKHEGKLTRNGYFFWVFDTDNSTVGRKQLRK